MPHKFMEVRYEYCGLYFSFFRKLLSTENGMS